MSAAGGGTPGRGGGGGGAAGPSVAAGTHAGARGIGGRAVLLAFLLGGWCFATVAIGFVAGASFGTLKPDRLPRGAEVYAPLGDAEAQRVALRYAASELNRFVFVRYHYAQVGLGTAALVVALAGGVGSRGARAAIGAALAIACVSAFGLTPELVALGRQIDFVPRNPPPPEIRRFYILHGAVEGLELVKLGLVIFATWRIARGRAQVRAAAPHASA